MNSLGSNFVSDSSQFFALVGVSQGVIDTVQLFNNESTAHAALDKVRDDYHPEQDDLQVFPVPLSPNSDYQILIVWTIEDVKKVATQKGLSLTDDQCVLILESLEDNYDAGIGIDWNTLDFAIDSFLEQ